jgi:hypothetical protein
MHGQGNFFRCRHCRRAFVPDYRNRSRQRYCQSSECRRASKQASQRRWCRKRENRDYFRDRVGYVQNWRKDHPGYWRKGGRRRDATLQEHCSTRLAHEGTARQGFEAAAGMGHGGTLQDLCRPEVPLLVGLIAQIRGALPEDIESCARQLIKRGQEILGKVPGIRTDPHYETG